MPDPFWTALGLTVLAGAATVAGGALAVLGRPLPPRVLGASLGLAAGVMVAVSFLEMLPTAQTALPGGGVVLAFCAGAVVYLLLDRLLPTPAGHGDAGQGAGPTGAARLRRLGLVTALAIGAHNVPEGFATFAGTLQDPEVGAAVALAMAVHNVPEGVAVAVPVRQATGSRRRAFAWAAATGLAEPLGALACYALLAPVLTPAVLAGAYAGVAGVMTALSLDALLPEARSAGGRTVTLAGVLAGVAAMALSLEALA